jgi:hypothetical protein
VFVASWISRRGSVHGIHPGADDRLERVEVAGAGPVISDRSSAGPIGLSLLRSVI